MLVPGAMKCAQEYGSKCPAAVGFAVAEKSFPESADGLEDIRVKGSFPELTTWDAGWMWYIVEHIGRGPNDVVYRGIHQFRLCETDGDRAAINADRGHPQQSCRVVCGASAAEWIDDPASP